VPIRGVLVVDPKGKARSEAFFSTDLTLSPQAIVEWFILRWNVEVIFEERRAHILRPPLNKLLQLTLKRLGRFA
jgi:hypothetical protein